MRLLGLFGEIRESQLQAPRGDSVMSKKIIVLGGGAAPTGKTAQRGNNSFRDILKVLHRTLATLS